MHGDRPFRLAGARGNGDPFGARFPLVFLFEAAVDGADFTTAGIEEHDVAMELLLCLGQGLWERLSDGELRAYWMLLCDEISMGIEGEIDEQALEEKRSLFESRSHANNVKRLRRYGRASLAGTVAEYVHSLWHEVTIRTGPEHLPARPLRRRLDLIARWFPPDRGYRLFPAAQRRGGSSPSALA